jgi:hypothetical protein
LAKYLHFYLTFCSLLLSGACGTDIDRTLANSGGSSAVETMVARLAFEPPPGTYAERVTVRVSSATADANIFCTTDGSIPDAFSPPYVGPVPITSTATLRCRGFRDDLLASEVTDGLFTIGGTPDRDDFHVVQVEVDLAVDGLETLRIEEGVMSLIHGSHQLPGNPVVAISQPGAPPRTVDPWNLSPYHDEEGVGPVSAPLDLVRPEGLQTLHAFIEPSSLQVFVGRGPVSVVSGNQIAIDDRAPSGWSAYWFRFEYWVAKP